MQPKCARYIYVLLFLLFSLLPGQQLQAGGQQEDPVLTAQALMNERRYNEAILVLTKLMKEDPDRFNEAEQLLQEVRRIRDRYNSYYNELIQVLNPPEGEEINEDRAYGLIRDMEALDSDPNEAAVEAFSEMRASIVFAVNNREFERLVALASRQLDQGLYEDAINTYLSGFGLHEELFLERENSRESLEASQSFRQGLRREAEGFLRKKPEIDAEYDRLRASLTADDPVGLERDIIPFSESNTGMAERRQRINSIAEELEALRIAIQSDEETDVPYLSALRVYARGPSSSLQAEGFAGALLRFRNTLYTPLFDDIADAAEGYYQSGVVAYSEGRLEAARSDFSLGLQYNRSLDLLIDSNGDDPELFREDERLLQESFSLAFNRYSRLSDLKERLDPEAQDLADPLPEEYARRRQRILDIRTAVEEELLPVQERIAEIDGTEAVRPIALLSQCSRAGSKLLDRTVSLELSSVADKRALEIVALQERFASLRKQMEQARAFVEGDEEQIAEDQDPVEVFRPDSALALIDEALPGLRGLDEEALAFFRLYEDEQTYVSSFERISSQREDVQGIRDGIAGLIELSGTLTAEAQRLNREANLVLSRGDLRLNEARAQLSANKFEQARDKLEQAGRALAQSLNFREDAEVRRRIDNEIPALAEEIIAEQNRLIVRQVRQLINRGRELFFQEKFIEAEQTFQRAQARWLQTHTEEEPEVNNWLVRVKRALETTTGVELLIADPLYPEMTQMLNLARKDYLEARKLFEQGDRNAALELFAEAERKIEYVKEPFPNNQAASILYLRLLQYTQPEDFDTIFSSRFNAARRQLSQAPEEAYRELKILEAIRPDFSGMERAIYDAEIATGIRQPPPDRAKLAKARDLFGDAEDIVARDIRAQFPVALEYLNEAIRLNPDYNEAIALKDRIQAGTGGAVRVVLSSYAQQRLKDAEDLFIEGRYFEAQVLVKELLQNEENRRNPRLLELERRIEARL